VVQTFVNTQVEHPTLVDLALVVLEEVSYEAGQALPHERP
jgi:hypothetical protein